MNSKSTTSYVRRRRSSLPVVYVGLLLSVLAILVVNDYAMRRVERGITTILNEHLPTTAYATLRNLTLECFLKSGEVSLNPNLENEGFLPDTHVIAICQIVESP